MSRPILVAAVLVASAALGGEPAPSLTSFVVGERVLLVNDDEESPLALRTRDELEAIGFFVVLREDDDVIDVVSTARALGAAAAVEVHGNRVDLWADVLLDPLRVAHAVLVATDDNRDVIALRAAELVRARMLRPRETKTPSTTSAPPQPPPPPLALSADASVGAQGAWAPSDVPPSFRVHASTQVRVRDVVMGAQLALPTAPARVDTATADADVLLTSADVGIGYRFVVGDGVAFTPSALVGGAWIHGSGRSKAGAEGRDGDLVVGHVGGAARVTWDVAAPISLVAEVQGGVLAPRPVLGVGGVAVPFGPFLGAVTIGVAARFGSEP
jgi:hypothetical protein